MAKEKEPEISLKATTPPVATPKPTTSKPATAENIASAIQDLLTAVNTITDEGIKKKITDRIKNEIETIKNASLYKLNGQNVNEKTNELLMLPDGSKSLVEFQNKTNKFIQAQLAAIKDEAERKNMTDQLIQRSNAVHELREKKLNEYLEEEQNKKANIGLELLKHRYGQAIGEDIQQTKATIGKSTPKNIAFLQAIANKENLRIVSDDGLSEIVYSPGENGGHNLSSNNPEDLAHAIIATGGPAEISGLPKNVDKVIAICQAYGITITIDEATRQRYNMNFLFNSIGEQKAYKQRLETQMAFNNNMKIIKARENGNPVFTEGFQPVANQEMQNTITNFHMLNYQQRKNYVESLGPEYQANLALWLKRESIDKNTLQIREEFNPKEDIDITTHKEKSEIKTAEDYIESLITHCDQCKVDYHKALETKKSDYYSNYFNTLKTDAERIKFLFNNDNIIYDRRPREKNEVEINRQSNLLEKFGQSHTPKENIQFRAEYLKQLYEAFEEMPLNSSLVKKFKNHVKAAVTMGVDEEQQEQILQQFDKYYTQKIEELDAVIRSNKTSALEKNQIEQVLLNVSDLNRYREEALEKRSLLPEWIRSKLAPEKEMPAPQPAPKPVEKPAPKPSSGPDLEKSEKSKKEQKEEGGLRFDVK